jgi:hypothetical protein
MSGPLRIDAPDGCRVVSLPQVPEPRGKLTALEELADLPFRIGTIRWLYDAYAGASWMSHADLGETFIVALSGSVDAVVGQGRLDDARVRLQRASVGLHVSSGVGWRIDDVSTNSVALVIGPDQGGARRVGLHAAGSADEVGMDLDSTIDDCRRIEFPRDRQRHVTTSTVTSFADVPFRVARVYYLHDVPGGARRGGHAHRELEEILVAVAGSFDVRLDDGRRAKTVRLDRAHTGVYVPTGIWRELENFSSGAICLVLASAPYDETEYIRDYDDFRRAKRVPTVEGDGEAKVRALAESEVANVAPFVSRSRG